MSSTSAQPGALSTAFKAVAFATAAIAAFTLGRTVLRQNSTAQIGARPLQICRCCGLESRRTQLSFACALLQCVLSEIEDPTTARRRRASNNNSEETAAGSCCSGSSSSSSASSGFVTAGSNPSTNPYETQSSVFEYLLMHYGGESELLNFPALQGEQMKGATSFPLQCAQLCAKYVRTVPSFAALDPAALRACDIGCAVGRSSFELTRSFGSVVGLDYSAAFVDAANKLKAGGELTYEMRTEGDLKQKAVARVDPQIVSTRRHAQHTSAAGKAVLCIDR